MSGGRWNYNQSSLGYEMFPYSDITYGLGEDNQYYHYTTNLKKARLSNPMHDKQISELVFDVLCLVQSADWYFSGDTGADQYEKDLKYFKKKWLKQTETALNKREIDQSISELRHDLYQTFGLEPLEDE